MNDIKIDPAQKPFVIMRTFDAPRETVWRAWTVVEQMKQWFAPKGFTIPVAKMDFRPGGVYHYCMQSADGHTMWGIYTYREIVAPERVVLVNSFSDEAGNLTRHPMSATWPLEMLSKFTLEDQGDKTKITVEWLPANATDEERKTFDATHDGMKTGWTGTFDQLEEYLRRS